MDIETHLLVCDKNIDPKWLQIKIFRKHLLVKANNIHSRKKYEIYSKLTIKTLKTLRTITTVSNKIALSNKNVTATGLEPTTT